MLNIRLYSLFNKINTEYNDIIIGGGNNNNNSKYKYTKILVDDPFNNRDIILRVTKKQKGVYI